MNDDKILFFWCGQASCCGPSSVVRLLTMRTAIYVLSHLIHMLLLQIVPSGDSEASVAHDTNSADATERGHQPVPQPLSHHDQSAALARGLQQARDTGTHQEHCQQLCQMKPHL